eukprot:scaffold14260_cov200-Alexandrium_tamarense.AAC.1
MDGSFRADASRLGLSPPVSLFVVALRRWHGRRAADDGVSGLLTAAEAVPPQDQNQANADGVRAGGGLLGGGSGSPGGNHRGGGGEEAGIPIGMGGDG